MPLVGICIMLCYGLSSLSSLSSRISRISLVGISAYGLLLAFTLYSTTSIWGQPQLASELWYLDQPKSPRATGYLLEHYVEENDFPAARRLLQKKLNDPSLGFFDELQRVA